MIVLAKRAVAVNQHHDAVSGTAKQAVTDDYALRLHRYNCKFLEVMLTYVITVTQYLTCVTSSAWSFFNESSNICYIVLPTYVLITREVAWSTRVMTQPSTYDVMTVV
jgi:hypothetical protein